jgi:hypothetical protein
MVYPHKLPTPPSSTSASEPKRYRLNIRTSAHLAGPRPGLTPEYLAHLKDRGAVRMDIVAPDGKRQSVPLK